MALLLAPSPPVSSKRRSRCVIERVDGVRRVVLYHPRHGRLLGAPMAVFANDVILHWYVHSEASPYSSFWGGGRDMGGAARPVRLDHSYFDPDDSLTSERLRPGLWKPLALIGPPGTRLQRDDDCIKYYCDES